MTHGIHSNLTEEELRFFNFVSAGKIRGIRSSKLFGVKGYFNDKLNEQGYSIWHVAINRQDEAMLLILLPDMPETMYYDLLLHAIQVNNMWIVREIVQRIQHEKSYLRSFGELERWEFSQYSWDITPIILAAQVRSYKLIKYFHRLGERFVPLRKDANIPKIRTHESDIRYNYRRLHEFQTKASPEMLCFRTNTELGFDPILEGLQMTQELKQIKDEEHELKGQYEVIQSKLYVFLSNLLDECKGFEKMLLLLSQQEGYSGHHDKYPRLMLAIQFKCYSFVVHPHCQKMLYTHWAEEWWPEWRVKGAFWKFGQLTARFLLLPFICFWLYFDLYSKQANFFRAPVNRCINDFVACLYFMILLGIEAFFYTQEWVADLHTTPCKVIECLIVAFVCGHILELGMQYVITPKKWNVRWSWYEKTTISFFIATFICWGITWYNEFSNPTPPGFKRVDWLAYDSVIVGQAFFSISIVLAYGRFLQFFQINNSLGPLQIAVANLVEDVFKFLFSFFVVMLTFSIGLYFLYSPTVDEEDIYISDYRDYMSTLHAVFWATLALSDIVTFEDSGEYITTAIGRLIWMLYYLIGPTALMVMLIGYMGSTLSKIERNVDAIWKWNRAKVWVYYMRHTAMPSPFNLIPSLHSLFHLYKWILHANELRRDCSSPSCHFGKDATELLEQDSNIRYQNLVRELVQGYLRSKLVADRERLVKAKNLRLVANKVTSLKRVLSYSEPY